MNVGALRAMAVGDAADVAFGGLEVPVDYDSERDQFIVQVRPLETDRIRLVLGARHERSKDRWVMPATLTQAHALSGVFSGRLESTPAAKAHVAKLSGWANDLSDWTFPDPILYGGPYEETATIPFVHLRVLWYGVPSVVPFSEAVLAAMLAEGAQQYGAKPSSSQSRKTEEIRSAAPFQSIERVREAIRQACSPEACRVGAWPGLGAWGDRPPQRREQEEQPSVEPTGDDAERTLQDASALFGFQRTDVARIGYTKSTLIGSEMGSGKSLLGALSIWFGGVGHNLVVCPNSMKFKWESEIQAWAPGLPVVVIDGTATQRRKQIAGASDDAVLVINYDSLRLHSRLKSWGGKQPSDAEKQPKELNELHYASIVLDEAHKIANPGTKQTMAAKALGDTASRRLAMTGTPVLNNPDDAHSIMQFVEPNEWGSRNQFRNRYCVMNNGWHGGFENVGLRPETRSEFDAFFLPRFIRRTKDEVLPDLPEKFPIEYRVIRMEAKQAKAYKALVEDSMALLDDALLVAENPLDLLTRLRQTACATPVVEDNQVTSLTTPSNKLNAIVDILEGAPGEPLVVYAESRKFVELLASKLEKDYRIGLITGAQGAATRGRTVEKFQAGDLDIILGTLGAGAEGLTLTRSNRIVLAQQSWSHAVNAQAIDRVHRIGQTRGVQPIVLISEGTVDVGTMMVDKEKEGRLQELVRDPAYLERLMRGQL